VKTVTPTQLRKNIYNLLDEVLDTGIPIEIQKGDRKLRIVPEEKIDKFQKLQYRPEAINAKPEELIDISWEEEINLDLP